MSNSIAVGWLLCSYIAGKFI